MRGFTARNTPYMGLVDRRPVVCRNLAMGFWVPLQYKTKMDKRSGFWQVDLTAAAQELLAFITPKGRVFK